MSVNLAEGPILVVLALGASVLISIAGATFRAVRARRARGSVRGYSFNDKLMTTIAAWILVFGLLAVAEFGRSRGLWRWGVLAGAAVAALIALGVVWQRYATGLLVDGEGFRFFGSVTASRGEWAELQDATWDRKREHLVLRLRDRTIRLAADLTGVREVALAASERLKKKL
jgi:hypothetical protein